MPVYTYSKGATVIPYAHFDPDDDCHALKDAMAGKGCKETEVINILCNRSGVQRQEIQDRYRQLYGSELEKDLLKELKGDLEHVLVSLCDSAAVFDAKELKKAFKGLGTDEDTMIEIMSSRTNNEIVAIREAYFQLYKKELEKDLASETSGNLKKVMLLLAQANRDECPGQVEMNQVRADAQEIWAGGKKFDKDHVNAILCTRGDCHVKKVFQVYQELAGEKGDLEKAIKKQVSGDDEKAYLALFKVLSNKHAYFAELLSLSMKGSGKRDDDLCRVIISRCEKDLLYIKAEYQKMYGKPLSKDLATECKGPYKEALLTLTGDD